MVGFRQKTTVVEEQKMWCALYTVGKTDKCCGRYLTDNDSNKFQEEKDSSGIQT